MSQKRTGLEKNRKVLTSIVGSIIVTAIGLTMTGPARAALPPFDVALPPPAIAFDARPALSAPPKDSPEIIEIALIICACIQGSMSAGATGAGIGSGLGALIGSGLGGAIGATIGAGAGGYMGAEIGHAHHRAFGHREGPSGAAGATGTSGTRMVTPDQYMTDGRETPLK